MIPSSERGLVSQRAERFYPNPDQMRERLARHPYAAEVLRYMTKRDEPIELLFEWPERRGGQLVDLGILRHLIAGNIVIFPFNADQLQANSYDVALGEYIYRWQGRMPQDAPVRHIYNPLDPDDVKGAWELEQAKEAQELLAQHGGVVLKNIKPTDKVIWLKPNEMILGHTVEFIGGVNLVIPGISGKSTSGRNGIEMCSDARMGNVGFVNRYTLEIFNKTPDNDKGRWIPLASGQTYASFEFQEANEPPAASYAGQYAKGVDIHQIMLDWKPEMMLPRMKRLPERELNQTNIDNVAKVLSGGTQQ